MSNPIDPDLAAVVGGATVRPSPRVTRDEAADAVAALRSASRRALGYVAEVTGLVEAADMAAHVPVLVVGRKGFVRANAKMLVTMSGGALDASGVETAVTSIEAGLALGMLSSRVLGQFDPFAPAPATFARPPAAQKVPAGGQLLFVAPNVVRFERELNVPAADFRLWVGLHEVTHAVQFQAAPWLAARLSEDLGDLLASEASMAAPVDAPRVARVMIRAVRGTPESNLARDVLSPPAQAVMDRISAVMSLLEGHADVVMDAVGPQVIPALAEIRRRFNTRRRGKHALDRLMRRLTGLEAKTAQYVDGAAFVRAVLEAGGHAGMAAAFAAEENLPTAREIADPSAWIARVLG